MSDGSYSFEDFFGPGAGGASPSSTPTQGQPDTSGGSGYSFEDFFGKGTPVKTTPTGQPSIAKPKAPTPIATTPAPIAPGPRASAVGKTTISQGNGQIPAGFQSQDIYDTGPIAQVQSLLGQAKSMKANSATDILDKVVQENALGPIASAFLTSFNTIKTFLGGNTNSGKNTTIKSVAGFAQDALDSFTGVLDNGSKAISQSAFGKTPTERVNGVLNAGLAGLNAAFIAPSLEFSAAKHFSEVEPTGVAAAGQKNLDKAMGALSSAGAYLAGRGIDAVPDAVLPQGSKDTLKPTFQEIGAQAAIMLGFHLAMSGGRKLQDIKTASDATTPFLQTLGIDTTKVPSAEELASTYQKRMEAIGSSSLSPEDQTSHAQIATTAYRALSDFQTMSASEFSAKWVESARVIQRALPDLQQQAIDNFQKVSDNHAVATALEARATPLEEAKPVSELSDNAKAAYVVDTASNFSKVLAEAQKTDPNVSSIDISSSKKLSTFDPQTGDIYLNRPAILELVDRMQKEGDYKPGETRAQLEERVIQGVIEEQKGTASSIAPEDALAYKAALETGDTKTQDKIQQKLEQTGPREEKDKVIRQMQFTEQMKNLSFTDSETEKGYKNWKAVVSRNPDAANLDYQGLSARFGKAEDRFGLSTSTDQSHDEMLDSFRERLAREGKLKTELNTPVQEKQTPVEGKAYSKIGESVEKKAIEQGITKGFERTAEYDVKTVKDQAKRVSDLLSSDFEQARAITRGEVPLPKEINASMFIRGMEEYVKESGSTELAYEVANSPLVTATSEAAQTLRFAQEREPDSASSKLAQIRKALVDNMGGDVKMKEATAKVQKSLDTETNKVNLSKEELSWNKFIDSIKC